MEKLNIADLLKDCPSGMELNCTIFEGLEFDDIVDNEYLPIRCRIKNLNGGYNVYNFTKYGCWLDTIFAKCVIFPKGKTTWEDFVPPHEFKDGDILAYDSNVGTTIFIHRNKNDEHTYKTSFYVGLNVIDDSLVVYNKYTLIALCDDCDTRLATDAEKVKLFQAIKDNGYHWNSDTKTLEKLIEPKFKVGDRIKYRSGEIVYRIVQITEDSYVLDNLCSIPISIEHMYNLIPTKFDINTLKPFDKVLVRNTNKDYWMISMFGYIRNYDKQYFMCIANSGFYQCIPYEGNEHLLGTTNDCDEYYKTW